MPPIYDCPEPLAKFFCFNAGRCRASYSTDSQRYFRYCQCALNYVGRRCEHLFDPTVHFVKTGFERQSQTSMFIALGVLGFLFLVVIIISCWWSSSR
ncbi:hypothetical protein M3Y98_00575300 [Aphelenchoides besseyi]|nr:hypothetical protein M3Y98_00575300 [Aphelenchoides besseyi]KAI6193830.1 hypothetical protein M3Y96_01060400 [Aphelenchoides besseyi]